MPKTTKPAPSKKPKPKPSAESEETWEPIVLRIRPSDKKKYLDQSAEDGFRNLSDWMRVTLNRACK